MRYDVSTWKSVFRYMIDTSLVVVDAEELGKPLSFNLLNV